MGSLILLLNVYGRIKFKLGFILLPVFLVMGCAQSVAVKSELAKRSGLDKEGRPIAFRALPSTRKGDIDWVTAIEEGTLNPLGSLEGDPEPAGSVLDLDIIFNVSTIYFVPNVVFPHKPHTLWLGCNNCHPAIFVMKQGGNPITMDRIAKREYCGRCHGVVAFSIRDCFRCHSRSKTLPVQPSKNP